MFARRIAVSVTVALAASLTMAGGIGASSAMADPTAPPVATPTTPAPAPTPPVVTDPATTKPATTTPPKKKPTRAQKAKAKALKAVRAALAKVKRGQYVRGRSGPNSFDCSGLMVYSYRKIGIKLAHSSRSLSTRGKKIARKNLKPGDLVFFYSPVSHVAMYIGGGKIVHARNPRNDLDITKLSQYPHYRWARRILKW